MVNPIFLSYQMCLRTGSTTQVYLSWTPDGGRLQHKCQNPQRHSDGRISHFPLLWGQHCCSRQSYCGYHRVCRTHLANTQSLKAIAASTLVYVFTRAAVTKKTLGVSQTLRSVTGSLDFLTFLIISMSVMCRIRFRLNASRDAYSSVLSSRVATEKRPWHSTKHMATTKSHASIQPCGKRHPAQALEMLHFGRFL